jgi:hypothetical protein
MAAVEVNGWPLSLKICGMCGDGSSLPSDAVEVYNGLREFLVITKMNKIILERQTFAQKIVRSIGGLLRPVLETSCMLLLRFP